MEPKGSVLGSSKVVLPCGGSWVPAESPGSRCIMCPEKRVWCPTLRGMTKGLSADKLGEGVWVAVGVALVHTPKWKASWDRTLRLR